MTAPTIALAALLATAPAATPKPKPKARPAAAKATRAPAAKTAPLVNERVVNERPAPPDDDPDRDRILRLQDDIAQLLAQPPLNRVRVGMRVLDAKTGRLLFARRKADLMDPASNQKVLATSAALLRLGPEYRFFTEVAGAPPDPEGVVAGDLVLRGSGDPSLGPDDVAALADELVRRGVARVAGAVVGDPRRLGDDQPTDAAGARGSLSVGRGRLAISVRPGRAAGAPVAVSVRPLSDAITVEAHATTRPGRRQRLTVSLSSRKGRLVVDVRGTLGIGRRGVAFVRAFPQPALHAALLLTAALEARGVPVAGGARGHTAEAPGAPPRAALAVHASDPLAVLCRRVNKASDNAWAERLLETLGAEVEGGAGTTAKGLRALRTALSSLGVPATGYRPANGSGLGHINRVTAETMTDMFVALERDPRIGADLLQSLSVGGIDGTTRNRFRGFPMAKRVRAKTGTLRGKSCLSGLVAADGEGVSFSMLMENVPRRGVQLVRGAQVHAVGAMWRYLRGGGEPDRPPLPDEPGRDFEVSDDLETQRALDEGEPESANTPEDRDTDDTDDTAPPADPGKLLDDLIEQDRNAPL